MKRSVQWFVLILSVATVCAAQPVVDGRFDAKEWARAVVYPLRVELPEGGITPGELYILNDSTDLYIAVRYERTTIDMLTEVTLTFDWQRDGIFNEGDDSVGVQAWGCGGSTFYDGVIATTAPPCAVVGSICNSNDQSRGGTEDGAAAVFRDGTVMTHEIRHPLYSGDVHDMAVKSRMSMPFHLHVNLANVVTYAWTSTYDKYRVQ
jgi:hypothetical protein